MCWSLYFSSFSNTMILTSQYPITFPSENLQYSLSIQWYMKNQYAAHQYYPKYIIWVWHRRVCIEGRKLYQEKLKQCSFFTFAILIELNQNTWSGSVKKTFEYNQTLYCSWLSIVILYSVFRKNNKSIKNAWPHKNFFDDGIVIQARLVY